MGSARRYSKKKRNAKKKRVFHRRQTGGQTVRPTSELVVSTVAGSGRAGYFDSTGTTAQFASMNGITIDRNGVLYVCDTGNNRIRTIDISGNVTTLAGNGTSIPDADNILGINAVFKTPFAAKLDPTQNNLYVVTADGGCLRSISLTTTGNPVTTLRTGLGVPTDLAVDSKGNVYIAERFGHKISKLTPETTAGVTKFTYSVLAGSGVVGSRNDTGVAATFNNPYKLAIDPTETFLYVLEINSRFLRKIIIATGVVTSVSITGVPITPNAQSIIMDSSENLYVADGSASGGFILKINSALVGSVFAGSLQRTGYQDSIVANALFNRPSGICIDSTGNLYVSETANWQQFPATTGNYRIRKIGPDNILSTVAGRVTVGMTRGTPGSINGSVTIATFDYPFGVCYDSFGNLYVSETSGQRIRKITPNGVVSTFAGSGQRGSADGTGIAALFDAPYHICSDPARNIYVTDSNNNKIRKITPDGVVTTFAGTGVPGGTNGPAATATFTGIYGICIDSTGNIYVVENGGCRVRKIDTAGNVTTFAGSGEIALVDGTGTAASFKYPTGICADPDGNLYVTDNHGTGIRKITPEGVVTTFIESVSAVPFANLQQGGICMDSIGNIYMATMAIIYKITPEAKVTRFAGTGGTLFTGDGAAISGGFNGIGQICIDPTGNIICAVGAHHTIRKITINPPLPTSTVAVTPSTSTVAETPSTSTVAETPSTSTVAVTPSTSTSTVAVTPSTSTSISIGRVFNSRSFNPQVKDSRVELTTPLLRSTVAATPSISTQPLLNSVSGQNDLLFKYTMPSLKLSGGTRKKRRASRRA
jgi:sugar lactone lactonase YvrE